MSTVTDDISPQATRTPETTRCHLSNPHSSHTQYRQLLYRFSLHPEMQAMQLAPHLNFNHTQAQTHRYTLSRSRQMVRKHPTCPMRKSTLRNTIVPPRLHKLRSTTHTSVFPKFTEVLTDQHKGKTLIGPRLSIRICRVHRVRSIRTAP